MYVMNGLGEKSFLRTTGLISWITPIFNIKEKELFGIQGSMKNYAHFLKFSFQKQIVWKIHFDWDSDKHVVSMRQISIDTENENNIFKTIFRIL